MHAIKAGCGKPKSLSIHARRERLIERSNKVRFCNGMGSGGKRMHWVYLAVAKQPMGWWAVMKGCSQQTKNS